MESTWPMWLNPALTGVSAHLLYFVVALAAIVLFVAIYTAITPYWEIRLIRQGNTAAAISLGGAILGYTCPLAQAVAQSGSLADMLLWERRCAGRAIGRLWRNPPSAAATVRPRKRG